MTVIEQEKGLLNVHIYSDMTLGDFQEFEGAVTDELKRYDHVNLPRIVTINPMSCSEKAVFLGMRVYASLSKRVA